MYVTLCGSYALVIQYLLKISQSPNELSSVGTMALVSTLVLGGG
jgi:hypothetical protein